MPPHALTAALLLFTTWPARALAPNPSEPRVIQVVDLERAGLDVERALSTLTGAGAGEVVLAATVARREPDDLVVLARRCEAARCKLVAARFQAPAAAAAPRLVASRVVADAAPDTTPGPFELPPPALADGDTVLVGWRGPAGAERIALRVTELEPIGRLFDYGLAGGGASKSILTIWQDGRWDASGAAGGRLTADELRTLGEAVRAARWTTTLTPPCPGRPERLVVTTAAGSVSYASGCGPTADASVLALVDAAERLTTRRPDPVLVRVSRSIVGAPDQPETAVVMRNGDWTTDRGRGVLDARALSELIALLDASLIEATPIADVAVCRPDRHYELVVPGRGELRFLWPCYRPSESLALALQRLHTLVGLPAQ